MWKVDFEDTNLVVIQMNAELYIFLIFKFLIVSGYFHAKMDWVVVWECHWYDSQYWRNILLWQHSKFGEGIIVQEQK